jgi:hypothetical protein
MNEDVACKADNLTKVAQKQVWQKLLLGGGGAYEVAWDTAAAVTPMGSLVYFAQYLNAGGLLGGLVADCPLAYRSGNAPGKREVIGTTILAVGGRGILWSLGRGSADSDREMGTKSGA